MTTSYMKTISDHLRDYSRKALSYGDAKAWDNRKGKAFNKITPRGSVYRRLMNQEWRMVTRPILEIAGKYEGLLKERDVAYETS